MNFVSIHRISASSAILLTALLPIAATANPVVTNVHGEQRTGTDLVDLYYDLDAVDSTSVSVRLDVSADGGVNWTVPVVNVSQSVGNGVRPGKGKHILWNAGADWNGHVSKNVRFKVTAVTSQNANSRGIGINFTGNVWFLQPTNQPGVVAGANWNNVSGASGIKVHLQDNIGASTNAQLSFVSTAPWASFLVPRTPNAATNLLYSGGLVGNDTISEVTVSITGIPYAAYDVYVYASQEGPLTNTLSISDGTTTYYYCSFGENYNDTTALIQTTGTDVSNPTRGAPQYQVFRGLTKSSFSLTTGGSLSCVLSNNVYGLQIVPTDESNGMVQIPAGSFQMGDASSDGNDDELPVHMVRVSAFYMGQYEVTKSLWDEVRTWGLSHGYTDLAAGAGKALDHPVNSISWYDMVKWCNGRSEKEGLNPCYTVLREVYRIGDISPDCNFQANGYRLPTEAEWEKAARGGITGKRFPWGDTISHSDANFTNDGGESYQSGSTGSDPIWSGNDESYPYTSPVGSFSVNGYGLYDMIGNVWEWCWDTYDSNYYTYSPESDPQGATIGAFRVFRGGGWNDLAYYSRVSTRGRHYPFARNSNYGFRLARSSAQ